VQSYGYGGTFYVTACVQVHILKSEYIVNLYSTFDYVAHFIGRESKFIRNYLWDR
jgi:hypothetical protein